MRLNGFRTVIKCAVVLQFVLGIIGSNADARRLVPSEIRATKQWTILVYMNSEQSSALDHLGNADIEKLKAVGSGDEINILVLRRSPTSEESTKISLIRSGGVEVVKDYGRRVDLNDPRSLVEFYQFAAEFYPANRYFLDLWEGVSSFSRVSHQVGDRALLGRRAREVNSGLDVRGIAQALREIKELRNGQAIEILCLDQGNAQSAELVYEVKDSLQLLLGTESLMPSNGWPYQALLESIKNQPTQTSEAIASLAAQLFVEHYSGANLPTFGVQQSVIAPLLISGIASQVSGLLTNLEAQSPQVLRSVYLSMVEAAKYGTSDSRDMIDFLQLYRDLQDLPPELKTQVDQVIPLLKSVILRNFVAGDAVKQSHGLGVWLPVTLEKYEGAEESYAELRWSRDTSWSRFLQKLMNPEVPPFVIAPKVLGQSNGPVFQGQSITISARISLSLPAPIGYKDLILRLIAPEGITLNSSVVPLREFKPGSVQDVSVQGRLADVLFPREVELRFVLEGGGKFLGENQFKVRVYSTSEGILFQKSLVLRGSSFGETIVVGDRVDFQVETRNLNPSSAVRDLVARVSSKNGDVSGMSEVIPVLNSGTTSTLSVKIDLPTSILGDSSHEFDVRLEASNAEVIQSSVPLTIHSVPQVIERSIESDHPYANNLNQMWTMTHPGACRLMVHFARLEVEPGADQVVITGTDSSQTYNRRYLNAFWSRPVSGNTVAVNLRTDGSIIDWGFLIDRIAIFSCETKNGS